MAQNISRKFYLLLSINNITLLCTPRNEIKINASFSRSVLEHDASYMGDSKGFFERNETRNGAPQKICWEVFFS